MITIKTEKEIEILRQGGKKLASVLRGVVDEIKPGIKTIELDKIAEKLIRDSGGEPSFKNYSPYNNVIYPASICVSVNEEIVHGIPGNRILKEGDIVGLDLGMKYKGMYTDMAITVPVGKISDNAKKIIDVAKKSLEKGIVSVKDGAFIGDIGFAIQSYVESQRFSVIRNLVGHGVGYGVHEDPEIPNFGIKGSGLKLKEGMVLALEPMINAGSSDTFLSDHNRTWKTADNSISAHFEHTIVVTKNGAEILTKI